GTNASTGAVLECLQASRQQKEQAWPLPRSVAGSTLADCGIPCAIVCTAAGHCGQGFAQAPGYGVGTVGGNIKRNPPGGGRTIGLSRLNDEQRRHDPGYDCGFDCNM